MNIETAEHTSIDRDTYIDRYTNRQKKKESRKLKQNKWEKMTANRKYKKDGSTMKGKRKL